MKFTVVASMGVVMVLGFAIFMTAFVNGSTYQTVFLEMIEDRLQIIGGDFKTNLQATMGKNIRLPDKQIIQNLLRDAKADDKRILSMQVVAAIGDDGHDDLTAHGRRSEGPEFMFYGSSQKPHDHSFWHDQENARFVLHMALTNRFEEKLGHIVVTYSSVSYDQKRRAMADRIRVTALLVFCATGLLACLGVFILHRRVALCFVKMARHLDRLTYDQWVPLSDPPAAHLEEHRYLEFNSTIKSLMNLLDETDGLQKDTAENKSTGAHEEI